MEELIRHCFLIMRCPWLTQVSVKTHSDDRGVMLDDLKPRIRDGFSPPLSPDLDQSNREVVICHRSQEIGNPNLVKFKPIQKEIRPR